MSEEQKVQKEAVQPQAPAEKPSAELTVQDLNALKQIIDVASQRGTFKPSEMMVVGQTYNKLEAFLAAVAAQKPKREGE
jgi:translation initiation factor IF-2